jgi:deoxyinosine 3'endonuclease (endonuclease V)
MDLDLNNLREVPDQPSAAVAELRWNPAEVMVDGDGELHRQGRAFE